MTATTDALWQAVEESPDDWDRYLVLADALNDAGEERLERAVRWMVREEKRPEYTHQSWWWDNAKYTSNDPLRTYSELPAEFFVKWKMFKHFGDSFLAAISWLADQLERVGM